jgi:hypothetical protein
MDARNTPKPVKMALRINDKVAKSPNELLRLIMNLKSELHTQNWRTLNRQPELKGQWPVLPIDWDSVNVTKENGHKIFTGIM